MNLSAPRHYYQGYPDLLEDYYRRGWTDGLPVVPPTPETVEAFLACAGLDPQEVVGVVPSWSVTVDAEHVAINAVMAGCLPEFMPVVVAAVRAITRPEQNVHSATATLGATQQVVIVNGPVRSELGVNCGQGCMGPGFRANATIGRALRLVIRNVMRAVPGDLDRSTFSSPGRYSFCFGENEEESPWVPLHVERGLAKGESAVTVFTVWGLLNASIKSKLPEAILDVMVEQFYFDHSLWEAGMGAPKDCVIVVGAEHMRALVGAGWSKGDIRRYLWDRLSALPGRRATPDSPQPLLLGGIDSLLVVAAGGGGYEASTLLSPHVGRASTEPIRTGGI